jgi:hypothetical protein
VGFSDIFSPRRREARRQIAELIREAHAQPVEGPMPTNVFVSCTSGSRDAHRLIAAVARAASSSMYGTIEQAEFVPAAVAVQPSSDVLLDIVGCEAEAGPRGLLRQRDLVGDCSVLVAVAAQLSKLECPWWGQFEPARRLVAETGPTAASQHDGSRVLSVDLESGRGIDDLIRALATVAGS